MKIVGLTGGIASGKSTVANLLRERFQATIIDLDQIARIVVQPNKPAYKKIVKIFGTEILNENGEINREKLGKIIFNDPQLRKKLNAITHFAIFVEMWKRILIQFLCLNRIVFIGWCDLLCALKGFCLSNYP